MKLFCCFVFTSTFVFATNMQEITLDKLQNKKIVAMSEKEFENYLNKQKALKERIEEKKEEKAKKIVAKFKMAETIISNEEKVAPLSVVENNLPKKIEKASTPIVEKTNTQSSLAEKINSLDLASAISFLLNKTNELSIYEFEQSKPLLINKMMEDKRFDKEALASMNVLAMNKNQFLVFISDLKTSMINR